MCLAFDAMLQESEHDRLVRLGRITPFDKISQKATQPATEVLSTLLTHAVDTTDPERPQTNRRVVMPADSRPTRRDRAQAREKKRWAGRKVNKYAALMPLFAFFFFFLMKHSLMNNTEPGTAMGAMRRMDESECGQGRTSQGDALRRETSPYA